MKFVSATNVGKKLGWSYQKINNFLAEEGLYNTQNKTPTEHAVTNGLAKIQTTVSRFNLKEVEYIAWNFEKLTELFPKLSQQKIQKKPMKQDRKNICHTSHNAFDVVCQSFVEFGDILRIEPGKFKEGISKEAQNAIIESYFYDCGFLGGPCLWHRHFTPEEAVKAKTITLKFANELFEKSEKISKKRAKQNLLIIEVTMQWLCDKAR